MAFAVEYTREYTRGIYGKPGEALTEVPPIAHPTQDHDTLPEVARHIEYLANNVPEDEAEAQVGECGQEERPEGGYVFGGKRWDNIGEDQRRKRDVH